MVRVRKDNLKTSNKRGFFQFSRKRSPEQILQEWQAEDSHIFSDLVKIKTQLTDIRGHIEDIIREMDLQLQIQRIGKGFAQPFNVFRIRLKHALYNERGFLENMIHEFKRRKYNIKYIRNDFRMITSRKVANNLDISPEYFNKMLDLVDIFIQVLKKIKRKNAYQLSLVSRHAYHNLISYAVRSHYIRKVWNPHPRKFSEVFYKYQMEHMSEKEMESLVNKAHNAKLEIMGVIMKDAPDPRKVTIETPIPIQQQSKSWTRRTYESAVASKTQLLGMAKGAGAVVSAAAILGGAYTLQEIIFTLSTIAYGYAYKIKGSR